MKQFISNLKESKNHDYKYSIEYRPIISNTNDGSGTIERVMKLAKDYGMAVGYSGLQGKPERVKRWRAEGLRINRYGGYQWGYKKNISHEVRQRIKYIAKKYKVNIFSKTSCLISYVHGYKRDYNAHYYRPNEVGCQGCVLDQKCFRFHSNLFPYALPQIPFKHKIVFKKKHVCSMKKKKICNFPTRDCSMIKGHLIKIRKKITTADVRMIKWLTGFTVEADFVESPFLSDEWKGD